MAYRGSSLLVISRRREEQRRRSNRSFLSTATLFFGVVVAFLCLAITSVKGASAVDQNVAIVNAGGDLRFVGGDKQEVAAAPAADAGAAPAAPPAEAAPAPAAPAAEAAPAPAAPPAEDADPNAPAPDADAPVAPAAPVRKKPGAPKAPAIDDAVDNSDDVAADNGEEDTPITTKKGKKKPSKSPTRRPVYNQEAAERWQNVPAVEVEVNSYEDEDGAVCSADSPSCNLRAALTFIGNRQGTVLLPTVEVHKLKKGPILVPMYSHITITSSGTAAQKKAVIYHRESATFGGGNSAILTVPENTTMTLDAVSFKNNPRRPVYGDRGSDITVLNCAFVNNTFDSEGAAIRVDYGSLTINQTLFLNNTDWSSGGAIYTTYSNLTIQSTNFLNNSASSGAALKAYQTELDIYGSHFGGGTAWSDGGALELVESTGNVYESIFENNMASSGGCVKMVGSNVTFSNIEFRRNQCKNTGAVFDGYLSNTTIEGCTFRRNHALNVGGCISGYQTQYNTFDSVFEYNMAESAGGVISLLGADLYDFRSTFKNNTAFLGGVVNVEDTAYVHLRDTTLLGNVATGNGAAVRINKAHAYLESVFAINNTVLPGGAAVFGEGGFLDTYLGIFTNHTNENGPVVEVHNTTVKFNSTMFRYNTAAKYAGALWLENSDVLAWNTTFYRNVAQKGGAVYIRNMVTEEDIEERGPKYTPRNVRFVDSTFLENVATDAGGAIEMSRAENVSTLNGAFIGNNATQFGGAVHMESSNATFVGTKFERNNAQFGAAVETYVSEFHTFACNIEENRAAWGGALEFKVSIFKCQGSTFSKNHAKFDGGAINCQNSTLELDDCKVENNVGENNAGGFWLESSNMTATGSSFTHNQAKARDGGAIFALDTDSKMRSCHFSKNSARKGDDLYNHGGEAEVYCMHIGNTYNKPKVGGHVSQDCFVCPRGRYGDFESAGSPVCEAECNIQSNAESCYDCPYELACDGQRTCKAGYRGEQCMLCKKDYVKMDGQQCLHQAAVAVVTIFGFVVVAAWIAYLTKGPVLDANQFTRIKILASLLQLLIMIGLVHNAFGNEVPFFIGLLKPIALWFDVGTIGAFVTESFFVITAFNIIIPMVIVLMLLQAQNLAYHRRMYYTDSNMTEALLWLKRERKIGQFTLLTAEMSWAPLLYHAAKLFYCFDLFYCFHTPHGKYMVWEPTVQCNASPALFVLRGISVATFALVGAVFPLLIRYIVVKHNQQDRINHPCTREIYKAIWESYNEYRLFYDLVFLGFRGALLLPLVAAHHGFVQAMVMLSFTGLYYFYYRGNSPFIKFEDTSDVEHPNLHYRAEESKVGLITFMLVVAAVGSKSEDMIEICGWIFVCLNSIILVLVFRNVALGIKNINKEPEESLIALAQTARQIALVQTARQVEMTIYGSGLEKASKAGKGEGGKEGKQDSNKLALSNEQKLSSPGKEGDMPQLRVESPPRNASESGAPAPTAEAPGTAAVTGGGVFGFFGRLWKSAVSSEGGSIDNRRQRRASSGGKDGSKSGKKGSKKAPDKQGSADESKVDRSGAGKDRRRSSSKKEKKEKKGTAGKGEEAAAGGGGGGEGGGGGGDTSAPTPTSLPPLPTSASTGTTTPEHQQQQQQGASSSSSTATTVVPVSPPPPPAVVVVPTPRTSTAAPTTAAPTPRSSQQAAPTVVAERGRTPSPPPPPVFEEISRMTTSELSEQGDASSAASTAKADSPPRPMTMAQRKAMFEKKTSSGGGGAGSYLGGRK